MSTIRIPVGRACHIDALAEVKTRWILRVRLVRSIVRDLPVGAAFERRVRSLGGRVRCQPVLSTPAALACPKSARDGSADRTRRSPRGSPSLRAPSERPGGGASAHAAPHRDERSARDAVARPDHEGSGMSARNMSKRSTSSATASIASTHRSTPFGVWTKRHAYTLHSCDGPIPGANAARTASTSESSPCHQCEHP